MEKTCNLDKLYERKHPRGWLPIEKCKECLFNVLCNDYIIYEESHCPEDSESLAVRKPAVERQ